MTKITRVSGANVRVLNLTRRCTMKYSQAVRSVAECACVWVEHGVSVRQMTPAEAIGARNERARLQERLPMAEVPGVVYRAAAGREALAELERLTAMDARQFASLAAAVGVEAPQIWARQHATAS